jgi:hypothetical protein
VGPAVGPPVNILGGVREFGAEVRTVLNMLCGDSYVPTNMQLVERLVDKSCHISGPGWWRLLWCWNIRLRGISIPNDTTSSATT